MYPSDSEEKNRMPLQEVIEKSLDALEILEPRFLSGLSSMQKSKETKLAPIEQLLQVN